MGDVPYKNLNFILESKGVHARWVDDQPPAGFWANMDNCEELAETAISNRLGTSIVNRTGNTLNRLAGVVHSLAKLSSLNGLAYRYAGANNNLYRRSATGQGPYALLSATMSGQPWQAQTYGSTQFTSQPYIFFADASGMLKDNGTLDVPQQMGIFQPQYPVTAQVQRPHAVQLDPFAGGTYTTSGITGFTQNVPVYPATTLTSPVTSTGVQEVTVANPEQMSLFQNVHVGTGAGLEVLLVMAVTATGFIGHFLKTHPAGDAVVGFGLTGSVPSLGTVTCVFHTKPVSSFGAQLSPEDYIGLQLFIGDPTDIQQIILKFDCGDGTFNTDYFYKIIAQGPLQQLLNTANQPATASTDAIITQALGVYGNADGSIAELNVGFNVWTPLLIQLSDFSGAGRADFNDPVYNWQNINGYQLTIVTNNNVSETVPFKMTSLVLIGGSGPDTFAGVAYDYLFTFFNAVDGTESNPCMSMSNVDPPLNTNWVYPRRQSVLLTMNTLTHRELPLPGQLQDMQITHLRIYRRGGTLGDNYRRVDQVQVNIAAGGLVRYTDTAADIDIQNSDIISFTNDVPVTSTLPTPVATTLTAAISVTGAGQAVTVNVGSTVNMSIGQQVSIGTIGALANNFETVIVIGLFTGGFAAFVQNSHAAGEPVSATATYGQPVTIMAQAFDQFWFAGDPDNPHYLYWSNASTPQAVSSAAYVAVGSPDDPITAIVPFKGNLFVSTTKFWWAVAPGSNQGGSPTVYPTAAKHGCISPTGWVATEKAIFYQAVDGIRAFAGAASDYLTQDQEFIFQGIGSSPILQAFPGSLNRVRMAYWNNMIFVGYIATDLGFHRLILHTEYKRWRNANYDCQSILLEADTNTLVYGGGDGLVHIDRLNQAFDEGASGNSMVQSPIPINLQAPYSDQGMPSITKSYQELTLDINTQGQTLQVFLLFEDGLQSFQVGTVQTNVRQKVNFNLNGGQGYEFYKVALKITGSVTQFVYVYQGSLKYLPLAKTRKSFDTFWLKLGTDESKVVKQVYFEYTSTTDLFFSVYYDGSATPGFTFTLPNSNGVRVSVRSRLPAVSCRLIRFVALSVNDFQIWESSRIEYKVLGTGKGWQVVEFVPNG